MRHKDNPTFYTTIMKNLRKGDSEYVFNASQIEEVKKRLEKDEQLKVEHKDDYIILTLERK